MIPRPSIKLKQHSQRSRDRTAVAFQFSLQALLRWHQVREDREKLRLAALTTHLVQKRTLYEEQDRSRRQAGRDLADFMQSGIVASEVHFDVEGLEWDTRRLKALAADVKRIEQARQTQQDAYIDAKKKRESLESLRTRRLDAYRLLQGRREQQQVDDLFGIRQGSNVQNS